MSSAGTTQIAEITLSSVAKITAIRAERTIRARQEQDATSIARARPQPAGTTERAITLHCDPRRLADVAVAFAALLAKTRDDQQRVVDAEGQAHHPDHADREEVHREEVIEDREQPAGRDHDGPADNDRHHRGQHRAEDEEQDEEQRRHRDHLPQLCRFFARLLQRIPDHRQPGDAGVDRLADPGVDRALHGRQDDRVPFRFGCFDPDDQGDDFRRRAETVDRAAAGPGRDHQQARRRFQAPRQLPSLALDPGVWPAQHHHHRGVAAELVEGDFVGALAGAAADEYRVIDEFVLEVTTGEGEHPDNRDPDPDDEARAPCRHAGDAEQQAGAV